MVRDPGRATSGPPPSQGGQLDHQERHRTHGTGAGGIRPTPSTVSGGRPPTGHSRGSSGRGVGATCAGISDGKTPRVTTGTASGSSSTSSQTSIPVTVSAPTPSVFAPATSGRGSIGRASGEGPSRPTLDPIDVSHMFEPGSNVAAFTREQMQKWMDRFLRLSFSSLLRRWGWGLLHLHLEVELRLSRRIPPDVIQMDRYGVPEGTDSLKVLGTMVREVCRLYLPDDAVWSDVLMTTRYDILDIAKRLAAKYGPISARQKNARARVESRRQKNAMATNPYGHQGFSGFRARFESINVLGTLRLGLIESVIVSLMFTKKPNHEEVRCLSGAEAQCFSPCSRMKKVFEFVRNGRDIPEVGECSSTEVGAVDGAAAVGGSAVGADGDDAEFDESSGEEENDHGQTPQQEPVEEDGEDEEDSPSRYEIQEHFREPVQPVQPIQPPVQPPAEPVITEAQRIIRFVMGGESSAPRTMALLPSVQSAILGSTAVSSAGHPSGSTRHSCTDCHYTDRHSTALSCADRSFRPLRCTDHSSRALLSTDPSSDSDI
ncbi:hypothetical protein R1sor_009034 [Riccia sorocarpa]|uniref:Uncharacterized protein n=1 Tax=Riccia sorocarpa TaxID=122646 RepID=A0ABD3H4N0_9MARC